LEEHAGQVELGLAGEYDADAIRAFPGVFVRPHGLDRPVTPILVDAIEELGQPAARAANASAAAASPVRTRS
jgi:hypothetical protein